MNESATTAPGSTVYEAFRGKPTSVISDNMDRLPGPVGLRFFHSGQQLLGRALTVRTRAGDNLAIHQALELVKPGDVVVVDGGGDVSRALVGEIMKSIAERRGATGFVIDGAVRDSAAFAKSDFRLLRARRDPPRSVQERSRRNQCAGQHRRMRHHARRYHRRR